jgi:hypothetical protein
VLVPSRGLAATVPAVIGDKSTVADGARKHSEDGVTAHMHLRTSYALERVLLGRNEMSLGGEMDCKILAGSCLSVLGRS